MHYVAGSIPVILRQISANQFTGVRPQNTIAVIFEPRVINKLFTYVNPNDITKTALAQGGLFDFGDDQNVRILEIRALSSLGNISVIVGDRIDSKTMTLTIGGGTPVINLVTLGVVAGDIVTVVSATVTEVYTVAQVNSTLVLETNELITPRALVAADSFSITNAGGLVKYAHTLAGGNTLNVTPSTTHNTAIGTPTASRLIFTEPLIIAPTQVLKIITAAGSAAGWLDVYTVKGSLTGR